MYYELHKDNYCYKSVNRLCRIYENFSDVSGNISNINPDPTLGEQLSIAAGAALRKVRSKLFGNYQ